MPERDSHRETQRRAEAAEVLKDLMTRERVRFLRLAALVTEGQLIDPEDVVQAACISFLTSYSPRGGSENPAGYFGAAIKTNAWKLMRSRNRKQRRNVSIEAAPESLELADDRELLDYDVDRIRDELAGLPERERLAVAMRLLGFSPSECAAAIEDRKSVV